MDKNKNKRMVFSAVITLLVVGLLYFSGPGSAIIVEMMAIDSVYLGRTATIKNTISVTTNEVVPVTSARLVITKPDGTNLTFLNMPLTQGNSLLSAVGEPSMQINATAASMGNTWRHGYGYAYKEGGGNAYGYGYTNYDSSPFHWGYGYMGYGGYAYIPDAYGYFIGGGPATLNYTIAWNVPLNYSNGTYNLKVVLETDKTTMESEQDLVVLAPSKQIYINEFMAHPNTDECEWIELYNPGDSNMSLDGWWIEDNTGNTYPFQTGGTGFNLSGKTVPANGYLLLTSNYGASCTGDFNFQLNNNDDMIVLKNGANTIIVDVITYGTGVGGTVTLDTAPDPEQGESLLRTSDGGDSWNVSDTPTPGAPNQLLDMNIPLLAGWNMISLPLTPENLSIESVLSSIDGNYTKVAAYDSTLSPVWQLYIVGESGNDLTEMDATQAYWIYMITNDTLTVSGSDLSNEERNLSMGWNHVGYPSPINRSVQDALSTIDGNYTKVAAYNPAVTPAWQLYIVGESGNDLTELSSGFGYWIYASVEDKLIFQ